MLKLPARTLLLLWCGAVWFCASVGGQTAAEFPSGKLIEKVVSRADSTQSYALYLPTSYDPKRKSPIIYGFDPGGDGKIPVALFQAAAEKYGFIVVGSHNSRNGMDDAAFQQTLVNLWEDTHGRLNIDERRVYATGFSGGARAASRLAASCKGCVAGVIAHGAGLSQHITVTPELGFAFFGAAGAEDFNFQELRRLEKILRENKLPHRIETFAGGHEWSPPNLREAAILWLEIQAMRIGRRAKDEKLIETAFRAAEERAARQTTAGEIAAAYRTQQNIVSDFAALRDTAAAVAAMERLKNSAELKKALKAEADAVAEEEKIFLELMNLRAQIEVDARELEPQREMRRRIGYLKKRDSAPIKRALNGLSAAAFESAAFGYKRAGKYELAAVNLEIAAQINPQWFAIPLEAARVYALDKQKKRALAALEKAVAAGFKDAARLAADEELKSLRGEPEFQKLLETLKTAAPATK